MLPPWSTPTGAELKQARPQSQWSDAVSVRAWGAHAARHVRADVFGKARRPALAEAKAKMESALSTIDQEAGAIDNHHRVAEVQVAILSSAKLDLAVRGAGAACADAPANPASALIRHSRGRWVAAGAPQKISMIKAARLVHYESRMRLATGPRTTQDVLVIVLNNVLLILREKEKDGHVAYRFVREVRLFCVSHS